MTLTNLFAVAAGRVDLGAIDGAFYTAPPANTVDVKELRR